MSGWIPIRKNLAKLPETIAIAKAIKKDPRDVVGRLHAVWAMADEQTSSGLLRDWTRDTVDGLSGVKNFAAAMAAEGWLKDVTGGGIVFPRFAKHNKTLKSRLQAQKRKEAQRQREAIARAKSSQMSRVTSRDTSVKSALIGTGTGTPTGTGIHQEGEGEPPPPVLIPPAADLDGQAVARVNLDALTRALGRWKGHPLRTDEDMHAVKLVQWAEDEPPIVLGNGQSRAVTLVLDDAISEAIKAGADYRQASTACAYIRAVVKRCRDQNCLPGQWPEKGVKAAAGASLADRTDWGQKARDL